MRAQRRKADPKTGKHGNAHGHVTRAISCGNLQDKCRTRSPQEAFCMDMEKCRTPIPRPAFCASLRSRHAHGHVTRAILCGNLQENAAHPFRARREHIEQRIYCDRKNPFSVATLFGELPLINLAHNLGPTGSYW